MSAKKRPTPKKRTARRKPTTALSIRPATLRGEVLEPQGDVLDGLMMPDHVKRALFEVGTWYLGMLAKFLFDIKRGIDKTDEPAPPKKL